MSLAETQELMATMKELMALLNGVEAKTQKMIQDAPQTTKALNTFNQLERVAVRYLTITRQIGLPDDAEKAIQILSQLIVLIRMAQMSLNMLAGGPYGLAMGAAGLLLAGLSAGSILEGY